jgi:hypothetical protein
MKSTELTKLHSTPRASCQMGLHITRMPGIELIIEEGV